MADEEKPAEEEKPKNKKEKKKKGKDQAKEEGAAEEGAEAVPLTEEEQAALDAKNKKKKKLIIIGAAVATVLLAGGGGGAFWWFKMRTHAEDEVKVAEKPIFYTMPEMIINLSAPGKQASFLKATIILELPKALDAVTVEAELPRLMDAFNTYTRELRPSDMAGTAGITRLREELLLRANKVLDPIKVNDILFKEIVVQ
jgi:flagellar FliL protein